MRRRTQKARSFETSIHAHVRKHTRKNVGGALTPEKGALTPEKKWLDRTNDANLAIKFRMIQSLISQEMPFYDKMTARRVFEYLTTDREHFDFLCIPYTPYVAKYHEYMLTQCNKWGTSRLAMNDAIIEMFSDGNYKNSFEKLGEVKPIELQHEALHQLHADEEIWQNGTCIFCNSVQAKFKHIVGILSYTFTPCNPRVQTKAFKISNLQEDTIIRIDMIWMDKTHKGNSEAPSHRLRFAYDATTNDFLMSSEDNKIETEPTIAEMRAAAMYVVLTAIQERMPQEDVRNNNMTRFFGTALKKALESHGVNHTLQQEWSLQNANTSMHRRLFKFYEFLRSGYADSVQGTYHKYVNKIANDNITEETLKHKDISYSDKNKELAMTYELHLCTSQLFKRNEAKENETFNEVKAKVENQPNGYFCWCRDIGRKQVFEWMNAGHKMLTTQEITDKIKLADTKNVSDVAVNEILGNTNNASDVVEEGSWYCGDKDFKWSKIKSTIEPSCITLYKSTNNNNGLLCKIKKQFKDKRLSNPRLYALHFTFIASKESDKKFHLELVVADTHLKDKSFTELLPISNAIQKYLDLDTTSSDDEPVQSEKTKQTTPSTPDVKKDWLLVTLSSIFAKDFKKSTNLPRMMRLIKECDLLTNESKDFMKIKDINKSEQQKLYLQLISTLQYPDFAQFQTDYGINIIAKYLTCLNHREPYASIKAYLDDTGLYNTFMQLCIFCGLCYFECYSYDADATNTTEYFVFDYEPEQKSMSIAKLCEDFFVKLWEGKLNKKINTNIKRQIDVRYLRVLIRQQLKDDKFNEKITNPSQFNLFWLFLKNARVFDISEIGIVKKYDVLLIMTVLSYIKDNFQTEPIPHIKDIKNNHLNYRPVFDSLQKEGVQDEKNVQNLMYYNLICAANGYQNLRKEVRVKQLKDTNSLEDWDIYAEPTSFIPAFLNVNQCINSMYGEYDMPSNEFIEMCNKEQTQRIQKEMDELKKYKSISINVKWFVELTNDTLKASLSTSNFTNRSLFVVDKFRIKGSNMVCNDTLTIKDTQTVDDVLHQTKVHPIKTFAGLQARFLALQRKSYVHHMKLQLSKEYSAKVAATSKIMNCFVIAYDRGRKQTAFYVNGALLILNEDNKHLVKYYPRTRFHALRRIMHKAKVPIQMIPPGSVLTAEPIAPTVAKWFVFGSRANRVEQEGNNTLWKDYIECLMERVKYKCTYSRRWSKPAPEGTPILNKLLSVEHDDPIVISNESDIAHGHTVFNLVNPFGGFVLRLSPHTTFKSTTTSYAHRYQLNKLLFNEENIGFFPFDALSDNTKIKYMARYSWISNPKKMFIWFIRQFYLSYKIFQRDRESSENEHKTPEHNPSEKEHVPPVKKPLLPEKSSKDIRQTNLQIVVAHLSSQHVNTLTLEALNSKFHWWSEAPYEMRDNKDQRHIEDFEKFIKAMEADDTYLYHTYSSIGVETDKEKIRKNVKESIESCEAKLKSMKTEATLHNLEENVKSLTGNDKVGMQKRIDNLRTHISELTKFVESQHTQMKPDSKEKGGKFTQHKFIPPQHTPKETTSDIPVEQGQESDQHSEKQKNEFIEFMLSTIESRKKRMASSKKEDYERYEKYNEMLTKESKTEQRQILKKQCDRHLLTRSCRSIELRRYVNYNEKQLLLILLGFHYPDSDYSQKEYVLLAFHESYDDMVTKEPPTQPVPPTPKAPAGTPPDQIHLDAQLSNETTHAPAPSPSPLPSAPPSPSPLPSAPSLS